MDGEATPETPRWIWVEYVIGQTPRQVKNNETLVRLRQIDRSWLDFQLLGAVSSLRESSVKPLPLLYWVRHAVPLLYVQLQRYLGPSMNK